MPKWVCSEMNHSRFQRIIIHFGRHVLGDCQFLARLNLALGKPHVQQVNLSQQLNLGWQLRFHPCRNSSIVFQWSNNMQQSHQHIWFSSLRPRVCIYVCICVMCAYVGICWHVKLPQTCWLQLWFVQGAGAFSGLSNIAEFGQVRSSFSLVEGELIGLTL